jgi:hypothetical protein
MKICIITAVWKRPEIFKIFAESILSLEGDIEVCVAGSEFEVSKDMVQSYGFNYIEAENDPLGAKFNKACMIASKIKAHYYLFLGSDDIINQELYNKYLTLIGKGYEYMYLTDGYFYDKVSRKCMYWSGYSRSRSRFKTGLALGCGKVVSRRLMERANWRPFETHVNKGLDSSFNRRMKLSDKYSIPIRVKDTDMCVMDIKSSTNITPFEKWENCNWVNGEDVINKYFPNLDI